MGLSYLSLDSHYLCGNSYGTSSYTPHLLQTHTWVTHTRDPADTAALRDTLNIWPRAPVPATAPTCTTPCCDSRGYRYLRPVYVLHFPLPCTHQPTVVAVARSTSPDLSHRLRQQCKMMQGWRIDWLTRECAPMHEHQVRRPHRPLATHTPTLRHTAAPRTLEDQTCPQNALVAIPWPRKHQRYVLTYYRLQKHTWL